MKFKLHLILPSALFSMVQCSGYGCYNRSADKSCKERGITFHLFPNRKNPRDEARKKEWIKAVRRDGWEPSKFSRLCSEHFIASDFNEGGQQKSLKNTAVPTVFKGFPAHLQKSLDEKNKPKRKPPAERGPPPVPAKAQKTESNEVDLNEIPGTSTDTEPKRVLSAEEILEKAKETQININTKNNAINIHNYSHPSSMDELKDKLEMVNELYVTHMENCSEELKSLRRENRILKGKVESMGELIEDLKLKNVLDADATQDIKDKYLTDEKNELIQKLMRKGVKTAKYDMDVLEFAQTLRFHSPKAYEFMATYLALPSKSTLYRHLRSFKCMPGIISEAVDALERARDDPKNGHKYKHASMVVDEMSIKEYVQLIRNLDGGTVFGTVDYGNSLHLETKDEKDKAANSVLVVMIVGYDGEWKLPIAYFFTRGLNAGIQAGLQRECLIATFQVRVKVLNVTLDGTEHNPIGKNHPFYFKIMII